MGKNEAGIILIISILIFSFAVLNWVACYHDNRITRERCDRMSASICSAKLLADGPVLRLVAGGDFTKTE